MPNPADRGRGGETGDRGVPSGSGQTGRDSGNHGGGDRGSNRGDPADPRGTGQTANPQGRGLPSGPPEGGGQQYSNVSRPAVTTPLSSGDLAEALNRTSPTGMTDAEWASFLSSNIDERGNLQGTPIPNVDFNNPDSLARYHDIFRETLGRTPIGQNETLDAIVGNLGDNPVSQVARFGIPFAMHAANALLGIEIDEAGYTRPREGGSFIGNAFQRINDALGTEMLLPGDPDYPGNQPDRGDGGSNRSPRNDGEDSASGQTDSEDADGEDSSVISANLSEAHSDFIKALEAQGFGKLANLSVAMFDVERTRQDDRIRRLANFVGLQDRESNA